MKVCLLNTYERVGGAARACRRLYEGLLSSGVDANLLVRGRETPGVPVAVSGSNCGGWLRAMLDELLLYRYPSRQKHNFSAAVTPAGAIKRAIQFNPDVLHLHWVPQGFIRVEDLQRITVPLVWTLHDSWPFTGGCHLPGDCTRYQEKCGTCPVLGSGMQKDLSSKVWTRKKKNYPLNRMTIVSPSCWMADKVRSSSLLGCCAVEVIPNALDTSVYSPGSKHAARNTLGLPGDKSIILFGAKSALTDPNKGADFFWQAMQGLSGNLSRKYAIVVFGEDTDRFSAPAGLNVINMGVVTDESKIVELYRAADVLVVTSRQENHPNMIAEAMSCGLPCVAFGVGGIPEQISHHKNGRLIEPFDIAAMSSELTGLLSSDDQCKGLALQAREEAVKCYSFENVVPQHIALYKK